ncbi:MAG: hypothetical protein MUE73_13350, partial [Planctomycetes bacterium]|nr:hypothetical protein [Planctomycetota bacterium]
KPKFIPKIKNIFAMDSNISPTIRALYSLSIHILIFIDRIHRRSCLSDRMSEQYLPGWRAGYPPPVRVRVRAAARMEE